MALPSPGTLFFEEALSLSPEECLRLRQWMFSTDYQDAAVTGENRTKSQFLQGIDVRPKHAENTPTGNKGEGSEAIPSGSELLDLHNQLDAADFEYLTSPEAVTSLLATCLATDTCNEAASVDVPVCGVTASKGIDANSHQEAVVASLRTDKRMSAAESCLEATSAGRREEAPAGTMCRKRIRKQPGLLSPGNKVCEGPLSDVRVRTLPTEKTLSFSKSSAARGTTVGESAAVFQFAPASFKARERAIHAATAAADCCSEIIEEKAGSLKVIVRKGNVCISKRFSPADNRDRLPDLMLHLEQMCPSNYSARPATTNGSLAVPATTREGAALAAAPGIIQDGTYHLSKAVRASVGASVGSGSPKALCVAPHSCKKMASSYEDCCSKRLMTENHVAKANSSENAGTLSAAGRVKAGAYLYRDWVCKHFDQVQHYLSCSKSYLQPEARSRERAASLALHMLLNLPEDTEQQRYLQWITTFLNASNLTANADNHLTNDTHSSMQQKDSASSHTAAASVRASSSNSPRSTLHRSQHSALCSNSGPAMRTSRDRVSPGFMTTPSPTKSSGVNKSSHSEAVVPPSGLNTSGLHLPSNTSSVAAVAAQLPDSLSLLDPTDCTPSRADRPLLASYQTPLQPKVSDVTLSQRSIVSTREEPTAMEAKRTLHQDDEERSRFHPSVGCPTDIAAAAIATLSRLRDATGHAAQRFTGAPAETATAVEPTTAAPRTAVSTTEGSRASADVEAASGVRAGSLVAYQSGLVTTTVPRAAALATAISIFPGATSEITRRAESKAEIAMPVSGAEFGVVAKGCGCTTPEMQATAEARADTAAQSTKRTVRWCADASGARATRSEVERSKAPNITRNIIPDLVAASATADIATMPAHGAGGPSSANACDILAEPEGIQVGVKASSTSPKRQLVEQRSCERATQVDSNDISNGEALPEEVIEAARAFVKSFSHEKDTATGMDQNDFFGMLQMFQTALQKPASDDAQQGAQQTQQQQVLQYVQQPKERQARLEDGEWQELNRTQQQQQEGEGNPVEDHIQQRNAEAEQPEEKEFLLQQQVGVEQLMQRQRLQKAVPGVRTQQQQLWEHGQQQRGENRKIDVRNHEDVTIQELGHHCEQHDRDKLLQALVVSDQLEQEQQQSQELQEQQTGISAENSICTLLYSLLQKRLPPASETSLNRESMLLQETSLSSHDTDCSSQNSRKVSSCAEDFLFQAMNCFTAKEISSGYSDGTSQGATQSEWRSTENAVNVAFPCYSDERTAVVEADGPSFCSKTTSSTSACASISRDSTCWPLCNSVDHPEQQHLTHEAAAPQPERELSLPVDETSHRSGDTEIFNNHATAAAVG